MNVAVTGAASTLARPVLGLLDQDPGVRSLRLLDIDPYDGLLSPKARFVRADVRDPQALRSAFAGADAVIHLAFIVLPKPSEWALIRKVNIDGSRNVLRAAAAAGVRKVIYTSSVAAYGAVPGHPPVLTEETPCRGLENEKNFYYAFTKAAVERDMDGFAAAHPGMVVSRFRPHILVGPNFLERTSNLSSLRPLARPSRSFWAFRPDGPNGRLLQYTHENDLARAIQYALHNDLAGAYNIAGAPLDLEAYLRARGKVLRPLPRRTARALAALAAPFVPRARAARDWLLSARYRNILDCSKLEKSGFGPRLRSTLDCIEEAAAYYERQDKTRGGRSARAKRSPS